MRALLAAVILSLALVPPPITLTVRPTIMMTRGEIHILVRIPRNAINRILSVSWDSDGGSIGETMRQLDGDNAPATFDLWLHDQPPAHYIFFATLFDDHGKICGRDQATITTPD